MYEKWQKSRHEEGKRGSKPVFVAFGADLLADDYNKHQSSAIFCCMPHYNY